MIKLQFILLGLLFISCHSHKEDKLTIATAANMQYAINDLVKKFTEESGIACEVIVASSGKLTAQISEGAPFDIFISADMKYPSILFNKGFSNSKPEIYAYGNLVLWTLNDSLDPSISALTDKKVIHIALANPKTAPYGVAALQTLEYFKIKDSIHNKLVYGESISQTSGFITSRAAEIGFTAKSVVLSEPMTGKGKWIEIDTNAYEPIAQGIIILDPQKETAQKFYEFIFSRKGKEILNNFGYSVPEK